MTKRKGKQGAGVNYGGFYEDAGERSRQRRPGFIEQEGPFAVHFPLPHELQRAVGIDPNGPPYDENGRSLVSELGLLRDEKGRFVNKDDLHYADAESRAYERWLLQQEDRMFGQSNRRGNPDMGTYRSKRRAADLQRERDRVTSCDWCGEPAPEKARSDWRRHGKCKVAYLRNQRKAGRA